MFDLRSSSGGFRGAAALCFVVLALVPSSRAGADPFFRECVLPVGGRVDGRIVGDMDGDGRCDLLILEGRRVVFHRQGEDGFGRWPAQVLRLDGRAMMVDAGDRAGRPGREIVFVGAGGVYAYEREKGRWKSEPVAWVEGETALRRGSGTPAVRDFFSDFDGDGRDDLLIPALGGYVLLRQEKDGRFSRFAELRVAPQVKVQIPRDGRLGSLGVIHRHPVPFIEDFDGDGHKDVVVRRKDVLDVFLGRQEGGFPEAPDFTLRTGLPAQEKQLGGRLQIAFEVPLFLGDFGEDGALDIVACLPLKGEALVFNRTRGREAGEPSFVFRMDGWPLGAMIRDLDGAKGPDLVIGGVDRIGIWSLLKIFLTKEVVVHAFFFLNRGEGRFDRKPDRTWDLAVPLKFATTAKGFRLGTTLAVNFDGDFNGDGRRDLVVKRGNVMLDLFLGDEEGVFLREPWRTVTIKNAESYRYLFPETFDLNGDGVSDLLLHYRDWSEKRDAVVLHLSRAGEEGK